MAHAQLYKQTFAIPVRLLRHRAYYCCNWSTRRRLGLLKLVKYARRFFAETAVRDILTEFLPLLSVGGDAAFSEGWFHKTQVFQSLLFMNLLLPTQHTSALLAWMDKFFVIWSWVENSSLWNGVWLGL